MDRRDFLKAAAALPLGAYLPAPEGRPLLTASSIKATIEGYWADQAALAPNGWWAILHPKQERDLRDLAARERWAMAYRDWRKDGRPEMSCSAILEKYRPIHTWDVDVGEVGSFENVRIIVADHV